MEWSPTRREFLGVAGAGSLAPASAGTASWGNVTDAVPDSPFAPEPGVRWSFALDDTPIVPTEPVDGTLYVRTRGVVHAISTDGTRRWRRELGYSLPNVVPGPKSAPPAGGRTVYANGDERVYALDDDDGGVRWVYEGEEYPAVLSAVRDVAVVLDEDLAAVSAGDGRERWRFDFDGNLRSPPRYDGRLLYVGTDRGKLYALDPDDGTERWRVELPERDGDAEPRYPALLTVEATDDLAFAWDLEESTLYAFETADGTERWRVRSAANAPWFTGAFRGDTVYFADRKAIRALSVADGTERWRFGAGSELGGIPQVVGDTVYVGSSDRIHAVSAATGRERWRSSATTWPTGVTDGTLVATDMGESIRGLSVDDGRVRWRYDFDASIRSFPCVHDGSVYFGTDSGTVGAISVPGPSLARVAYRTAASPAGVAVGGLVGGALAVGAYRRRNRADADPDPADPETVADFELVGLLAETDAAEVHEARTPGGERVALKRLAADALSDDRFAAAVETWADLDHEGVLDVRAWGTDPAPWVATEYADATLAERAADLTVEEIAHAVADAAEAVHRAHRDGAVHGGLAPGNVVLVGDAVRVADWGLAAALRGSSGERPTPADDTSRLAEQARGLLGDRKTEALAEVLARALAPDPADRYDSALKFADALRWAVRE